jgi:hypothetical protein
MRDANEEAGSAAQSRNQGTGEAEKNAASVTTQDDSAKGSTAAPVTAEARGLTTTAATAAGGLAGTHLAGKREGEGSG